MTGIVPGTDGCHSAAHERRAKLPPGMEFNAEVAAVGADRHDDACAFNRGRHRSLQTPIKVS